MVTAPGHHSYGIDWNAISKDVGDHARLSYDDLEEQRASRPLDFPAPVVGRCSRTSVTIYDPKKGEYHSVRNVLAQHKTHHHHRHHRMRGRDGVIHRNEESGGSSSSTSACDSNGADEKELHAYYIKRKLATSTHGAVYKGVVLKKRKVVLGENTVIKRQPSNLIVIEEDDELDLRMVDSSNSINQEIIGGDDDVWEVTKENVIIKTASWERIRRLRGKHLEDPLKEIQALQLVGDYHPHIIRSIVALQDDKYLYSITNYCKNGDLYSVVMNDITTEGRVNERKTRHWFRQLLVSLHHFQLKGVCHRNLSLENIVVHGRDCKIIDFGLALRIPYHNPHNLGGNTDVSDGSRRLLVLAQGQGGELTYMAPEVFSRQPSFDGFAIDLWAVGIILYIMLVGHKPFNFPHLSDEQFCRLAEDGLLKESLDHAGIKLSDEACDLMQKMLWKDQRKRLTLAEVMQHAWVRGHTISPCSSTNSIDGSVTVHRPQLPPPKGSKRWFQRKKNS